MTTHMGYLPDIGRWVLWGAIGVVVIGVVWFVWIVKGWGSRGGKR